MHKLQLFICRAAELVALSQYHLKKSGQILKWHSSKHSYYYLLRKLCEAYIYLALASSSRCPGVPTETKMRHKLWSAANTIPLPNPLKNLHVHQLIYHSTYLALHSGKTSNENSLQMIPKSKYKSKPGQLSTILVHMNICIEGATVLEKDI